MNRILVIQQKLQESAHIPLNQRTIFYKTGPGDYAAHDQFIGVSVPMLRALALEYEFLTLSELQMLIQSPINEERLFALIVLTRQYQKSDLLSQEILYQFYMNNLSHVNNWNLVDASAHWIVGKHLLRRNRDTLLSLAESSVMWYRRIAIVSTWMFIRHGDVVWTFALAKHLLADAHNLMHKAVGWMLREAGKRNPNTLCTFLDQNAPFMPRTMLRAAIEKLSHDQRKNYMARKRHIVS